MFCAECGKPVVNSALFCVYCGAKVASAQQAAGPDATQAPARVLHTPPAPPAAGPAPAAPMMAAPVPPPPPGMAQPAYAPAMAMPYGSPPPTGYAAAYAAAPAATGKASALRYAAAACFVVALVGSFLRLIALGGEEAEAGFWGMAWQDSWWGPAAAACVAVALISVLIPKRIAVAAAAVLTLPAIVLLAIRGSDYIKLGKQMNTTGFSLHMGEGWYLLIGLTFIGLIICVVALLKMGRKAAPAMPYGAFTPPRVS